MLKKRLIPCLFLKNGHLVRSEKFSYHQLLGDPLHQVERISAWNADELIYVDISDTSEYDLRRDDMKNKRMDNLLEIISSVSQKCFVPLTFGGNIKTIEQIREILKAGADKILINTIAIENPEFITKSAAIFGSQCIVVGIDIKKSKEGTYEVYSHHGKNPTGKNPLEWAKEVERLGAGEIFLNSIDQDGTALGYDLEIIKSITEITNIPVIACGGAGVFEHFAECFNKANPDAVAAGNIFNYTENSIIRANKNLQKSGINVRKGLSIKVIPNKKMVRPPKMRYCSKCVYPSSSAIPLAFDSNGVCSGCRIHEQKKQIDWKKREEILKQIVDKYRSKDKSNYDCIIPVSGGKDSYFQTYYVTKVLGLKPLLVTYHGNNYLEVAERNLKRMREVFNVDQIVFGPNVDLLKKLNKKCFIKMGDMNWHNHCGIFTYPVQIAVKLNIPLIIWGEHGYTDLGGMYSMYDLVEMTRKYRTEHACRGYDWFDMLDKDMGITEQDVLWAKYPSDEEIEEKDVRGIYLGLYVHWDANIHVKKMVEEFGWEVSPEPFDRTYRLFSNLDDMHENGAHDYLKYIKFGYGRATDHVCKDVRAGIMTREQGIEMVKKYDHVKPKDLKRWLSYVNMSEEEFDAIADTFRDPKVWWKNEKGEWVKDNIWDNEAINNA